MPAKSCNNASAGTVLQYLDLLQKLPFFLQYLSGLSLIIQEPLLAFLQHEDKYRTKLKSVSLRISLELNFRQT